MKIVCDACSAKYSIADDKVKGKVFKIRCKKCSNIIVVRGSGPGAAVGAGGVDDAPAPQFDQKETRVYDYGADGGDAGAAAGDEAVWHIVVDQEQVGPVTVAEVQRRFAAGEIDADTFIWREGFADWQPLSQVEQFAGVVSGGAPRAAAPSALGGSPMDDGLFGGVGGADDGGTMKSDPADLFAAAAAPAGALGAAGDEDEEGGDLFGAARGASKRSSEEMAAASPRGGGVAAEKKLRGERNENSVLFSLGNLAALASEAPRSSASSSSSSSAPSASAASAGAAQHAGGEGSGLIDIRSMASAYMGDQRGAAKAKPQVGSVDDLPVFSSASFSEPVVIMPTARSGGSDKKLLYALVAVVGLLALVAIVLVVMVLGGNKKDTAAAGQVAMGTAGAGTGAPGTVTPGSGAQPGSSAASGAATGSAGSGSASGSSAEAAGSGSASGATEGSAAGSAGATGGSAVAAETSHSGKTTKPPKGGTRVAEATDHHKEPKGGTAAATPPGGDAGTAPKGKCMDEVGCLLAEHPPACCAAYKGGGGSKPKGGGGGGADTGGGGGGGAVDTSLPEELDRAAVSDGVGKVRGRINACGDKSSAKGEVKVGVKVSPSGSVASVSVKNTPDPALGSCVASAMQGAHFSKTQKGGSFSYPFIFR